jgi:hypothetical protein
MKCESSFLDQMAQVIIGDIPMSLLMTPGIHRKLSVMEEGEFLYGDARYEH